MKLFVASDIHGDAVSLKKFFSIVDKYLEKDRNCRVVLLGDIYNHGPRNPIPVGYNPQEVAHTLNEAMTFLTVIKGNCDSEVDEMISNFPFIPYFEMDWGNSALYFTHGHTINKDMPYKGDPSKNNIVLHGHFHVPRIDVVDGVTYVCVGSIGMNPTNVPKSYCVLDDNTLSLYDLDENLLETINI